MIEIKILGPGCRNCELVEQIVRNACAELNIAASIEKITDRNKFLEYGVFLTPGLIINGKLVSSGKIPTKSTVIHWLEEAQNTKQ
ncbi:MAG: thioredoxin family protein [Bacteroidetes bacterium]|nr:thioredoxin family protein [Bacteroidota bacterium]